MPLESPIRTIAFILLFVSLAVSGCDDEAPPTAANSPKAHSISGLAVSAPIGFTCWAQFRRDALGAAADSPIAPTVSAHNGAATSVSGKLLRADSEWIVVQKENGTEMWIPQDVVLLLESNRK